MSDLRAAFLDALEEPRRAEAAAHATLDSILEGWMTEARSTWPSGAPSRKAAGAIAGEELMRHVATRLRPDLPIDTALADIRAVDLYGALACAAGDGGAIRVFESRCFGELEAVWPQYRELVSLEDARQMLRQKLFLRGANGEAKVLSYAGRGDVRGWVRVVAGRMLADLTDRKRRERPVDELFFDKLGDGADPELDRFKDHYGAEFKEAFRVAVDALSARERTLLRHAYVRGATVVEIGAAYGVHGATAARWVASARDHLVRALRKAFAERLQVGAVELESVMRLLESNAHVTLERYFKELGPGT